MSSRTDPGHHDGVCARTQASRKLSIDIDGAVRRNGRRGQLHGIRIHRDRDNRVGLQPIGLHADGGSRCRCTDTSTELHLQSRWRTLVSEYAAVCQSSSTGRSYSGPWGRRTGTTGLTWLTLRLLTGTTGLTRLTWLTRLTGTTGLTRLTGTTGLTRLTRLTWLTRLT